MFGMETPGRGRPRSFDREAALDKAIHVFWTKGYEATSIRDLTHALGIAPPSLYAAFGAKEQLFAEALELYDRTYGGFVQAAITEEPTAYAAAARLLRQGPEMYTRDHCPTGCLIESGDAGAQDEVIHAHGNRLRLRGISALARRIERDIAAGRLDPATDAEALARFTFGTLGALARAAQEHVSRETLRRMADIALSAWQTSLADQPPGLNQPGA